MTKPVWRLLPSSVRSFAGQIVDGDCAACDDLGLLERKTTAPLAGYARTNGNVALPDNFVRDLASGKSSNFRL
jgi:hypothetical protein